MASNLNLVGFLLVLVSSVSCLLGGPGITINITSQGLNELSMFATPLFVDFANQAPLIVSKDTALMDFTITITNVGLSSLQLSVPDDTTNTLAVTLQGLGFLMRVVGKSKLLDVNRTVTFNQSDVFPQFQVSWTPSTGNPVIKLSMLDLEINIPALPGWVNSLINEFLPTLIKGRINDALTNITTHLILKKALPSPLNFKEFDYSLYSNIKLTRSISTIQLKGDIHPIKGPSCSLPVAPVLQSSSTKGFQIYVNQALFPCALQGVPFTQLVLGMANITFDKRLALGIQLNTTNMINMTPSGIGLAVGPKITVTTPAANGSAIEIDVGVNAVMNISLIKTGANYSMAYQMYNPQVNASVPVIGSQLSPAFRREIQQFNFTSWNQDIMAKIPMSKTFPLNITNEIAALLNAPTIQSHYGSLFIGLDFF